MANKRFNQITRVVTSFDSNDVLPIGNGTLGDGKMTGDQLLELTAQNAFNFSKEQDFFATKQSLANETARAVTRENEIEGLFVLPTEEAVAVWLDAHPEATTTVQDHSLSIDKLIVGTLNYVTPEMYGAVGDGVADDTEALQEAINSGKPVYCEKVYGFTELSLVSGLELFGNGRLLYIVRPNVSGRAYYPIRGMNVKNVKIHGLTFDGNEANADLDDSVFAVCDTLTISGKNIEIFNCKFVNNCDSGIMFSECKYSQIHHCYFNIATDCGIYVNANDNQDSMYMFSIHDNIFCNIRHSGIALKRLVSYGQVNSNIMHACGNGITTEHASTPSDYSTHLDFCNNYIHSISGIGILVRGGECFTVNSNRIEEVASLAISIDSARKVSCCCNVIDNQSATGKGIEVTCRDNDYPTQRINICDNVISVYKNFGVHFFHAFGHRIFSEINLLNNNIHNIDVGTQGSKASIEIQSSHTITKLKIKNNIIDNCSFPGDNVAEILFSQNDVSIGISANTIILTDRIISYGNARQNVYVANVSSLAANYTFNKGDIVNYTNNGTVVQQIASAAGLGSAVLKTCVSYTN